MEERAGTLQDLRILVAEDEALVVMQIEAMLERLGCKIVDPVPTVASALSAIESTELDGALLDMNLRGESVEAVAETLVATQVPFLLVTGYSRRSGEAAILKDAPRLSKPFTRQDLSTAMLDAFTTHGQRNGR